MLHHKRAVGLFALLVTCQLYSAATDPNNAGQISIEQAVSCKLDETNRRAWLASVPQKGVCAVECIGAEQDAAWAELAVILQPFITVTPQD